MQAYISFSFFSNDKYDCVQLLGHHQGPILKGDKSIIASIQEMLHPSFFIMF